MTKNFKLFIANTFGFTFEIPSIDSFDEIYFVVRESVMDDEPTIVKTINDMQHITDNKYRVTLSQDDTENLMPLNYLYGLQVVYGSNVKTVLEGKLLVDIDPARTKDE